jgi:hypothetical protein
VPHQTRVPGTIFFLEFSQHNLVLLPHTPRRSRGLPSTSTACALFLVASLTANSRAWTKLVVDATPLPAMSKAVP